jgi:hypothetical protein
VLALLVPTLASADPPPPSPLSGPAATCSNPPGNPDATPANRDRFIGLWAPRISATTWIQNYLDTPGIPASIQAEGFQSMDNAVKAWLVACLVDNVILTKGLNGGGPGVTPTTAQLNVDLAGTAMIIFGKSQLDDFQAKGATPAVTGTGTPPQPSPLQPLVDAIAHTPAVPAPAPAGVPSLPAVKSIGANVSVGANATLSALLGHPNPLISASVSASASASATVTPPTLDPQSLINLIIGLLGSPPISNILAILNTLLTDVANVQQLLFTVPGLNLIGGATYRVCAESATLPLSCSISLPVGVPIPVDVTGDHVPDVIAELLPQVFVPRLVGGNLALDAGASFEVRRLFPGTGPLPAHVFMVWDPPATSRRIEYGYDGRPSTLADDANTTFTLRNALGTLAGDVEMTLNDTHTNPGAVEAETVAVKTLQPQGIGKAPKELDPMAGAVQFQPVPTSLTAGLHLTHSLARDEDIITVNPNRASTTTIDFTQDVTSLLPQSHREFQALIDQLPTSVGLDLVHQGDVQTINYTGSAGINHVHASDTAIGDTSHPQTYTRSDYDVLGVPTAVNVTLTGSSDIVYKASSVVPQAQFTMQSLKDGVLQKLIAATAKGVPTNIHVNQAAGGDNSVVTYDADSSLASIALALFDLNQDSTMLDALALSLPTHASLASTKSTGVLDYTSSGPIGVLAAALTRQGGALLLPPNCVALPTPPPVNCGDHATVLKRGNGLGVDIKISGLTSAHADPSAKASYTLGLSPGGQSFVGEADLDAPNVHAIVTVSNLPSSIAITLDPAGGGATYTASSVISAVTGFFAQRNASFVNQLIGQVTMTAIPTSISMSWATAGANPSVTYSANGRLGSLGVFYQQAPGSTTFSGTVGDLPPFMQVTGSDPAVFTAQTSALAAQGSDHIGSIRFLYASDGSLVASPDPNDHLVVNVGATTHADLLYSGLSFFNVSTGGKNLHAEVRNTAPRRFDVVLTTPSLSANGFVDKVPAFVVFDMAGQEAKYSASSGITEIVFAVDRLNGESLNVDVTGVPKTIDLLFDSVNSTVSWVASDTTGGVNVTAQFGPPSTGSARTFNASLTLSGIPASWNAAYGAGHVLFQANLGGSIGLIAASFTNHGTVPTLPGDGLAVNFTESSGDLDAALQISKLTKAEFQKLAGVPGGFDAALNMGVGVGEKFSVNAALSRSDNTVLALSGLFQDMPSSLHLRSEGGVITYNGNIHPTLTLDASYGDAAAVAALPATSFVHGLKVRDAASGGRTAVGAKLFLTGLPLGLSLDTAGGVYGVTSFAPSQDPLTLDVALNNLVTTPISLLAVQNVGTASPVNFTFGPFTTGVGGDGSDQIHAQYTASRAMGSFDATATAGTNVAQVHLSNVPSSATIDTSFGADTKTITIALGTPISEVSAYYRRASDAAFVAGAKLTTVPTSTVITIGKQDGGAGIAAPIFNYTASAAGMGLTAFVDASAFSPSLHAQVQVDATSLGASITAGLSGTQLQLASTPATGSFKIVGTGVFNIPISLNFDAGPFHNTGDMSINLNVTQLILGFTNMNTLTLKLGISTAIEGNYGSFTFGETSDTHVSVHDKLKVDFGICTCTVLKFNQDNIDLGNVIGNFRMADNVLDDWFTFPTFIPCSPISLVFAHIKLRPHPRFTTSGSSFTVNAVDAKGGAWIATVNPKGIAPDFIMDIVARFASPDGGDQGFSLSCDSVI